MPDVTVQPDGTPVDPTKSITEEQTDTQRQQQGASNMAKLALVMGA